MAHLRDEVGLELAQVGFAPDEDEDEDDAGADGEHEGDGEDPEDEVVLLPA